MANCDPNLTKEQRLFRATMWAIRKSRDSYWTQDAAVMAARYYEVDWEEVLSLVKAKINSIKGVNPKKYEIEVQKNFYGAKEN